jgi:glycosyltransferase involved in cell wall biosynthesis
MSIDPPRALPIAAAGRCCVVICDYDGWAQTQRCLRALAGGSWRDFDVILVDHGTTATTREGLAREFPHVIRIEASPSLWWAGATNVGVRAALDRGADPVMLLNNDCYLRPESFAQLLRHARARPGAIVAPVQRDAHTGRIIAIAPRHCLLLGFTTLAGPRRVTPAMRARGLRPVGLIKGGRGVLIPAAVFRRVGLFDQDRLPHYFADHDFYWRCHAQGVPMYVAPDTEVDIDETRSSVAASAYGQGLAGLRQALTSPRSHRNLRDQRAIYRKHYPLPGLHRLGLLLFLARFMVVFLSRDLQARARGLIRRSA